MERVADILTKYVMSKGRKVHVEAEVLKYGMQIGLELLICISANLIIAIAIHMIIEYMVLLLVFISLRSYAGGIHLNKFSSCFICSSLVIVGILMSAKNTYTPIKIVALTIVACLICIYIMAPVENINRYLESDEKKYFRKKLMTRELGILCISVVLLFQHQEIYLKVISMTLVAIVISMIIAKKRR